MLNWEASVRVEWKDYTCVSESNSPKERKSKDSLENLFFFLTLKRKKVLITFEMNNHIKYEFSGWLFSSDYSAVPSHIYIYTLSLKLTVNICFWSEGFMRQCLNVDLQDFLTDPHLSPRKCHSLKDLLQKTLVTYSFTINILGLFLFVSIGAPKEVHI